MKKFPKITILSTLFVLLIVGLFNYTIDPLWNFTHKNKFNQYQMGIDERQGKTNVINFRNFNYNALMIGTSRVTYINQNDLKDYKAFNYAVAKMRPCEYNDYTQYAKEKNKKEFNIIFLGIDMTSAEYIKSDEYKTQKEYREISESFLYRYKTLFSIDTLRYSFKNFKNVVFEKYKKRIQTYDRDIIVHSYPKSAEFVNSDIAPYLSDATLMYDEDYKQRLLDLKKNNPNTKFYIFTTPITSIRLLKRLSNDKNLDFYTRWLKETVEVFGEVYNFTTLNKVTKNYTKTFTGVSHFYPYVGTHIVNKVFNYEDDDKFYKDFGQKLTEHNFDEEIAKVVKSLKQ